MVKLKTSPASKLNKQKSPFDKKVNSKSLGIKKKPVRNRSRRRGFLKKKIREPKGVVYICHIPHGFYEDQIEAYFSQFGKVTGVNVPRSKSGRAKGYAFIEYRYPEIAQIAADTMNNYLMLNRLLKATYIPPEKQKPHLFRKVKEARENQQTLADKAELAVKHSRKVKNRSLKLPLEANKIQRLLKKKNLLGKRMMKSGLSPDVEVEEANYQSILQQKKKLVELSKSKSDKLELKSENEEDSDDYEENSSFSDDADDSQSFQSDDSLSEDNHQDFHMESDEEDRHKSIRKSLAAAREILKKNAKRKKPDTPLEAKSPRKSVLNDVTKTVKNNTPTSLRAQKSLKKDVSSLIGQTPSSVKKSKAALKTPTGRKSNVSQIVMEVENNDEKINSKTPDSIKKLFKARKNSPKKTPKSNIISQVSPNKQISSKKTPMKEVKSPKEVTIALRSPTGKKMRYRNSKSMNAL